jgi:hypothetical protein
MHPPWKDRYNMSSESPAAASTVVPSTGVYSRSNAINKGKPTMARGVERPGYTSNAMSLATAQEEIRATEVRKLIMETAFSPKKAHGLDISLDHLSESSEVTEIDESRKFYVTCTERPANDIGVATISNISFK